MNNLFVEIKSVTSLDDFIARLNGSPGILFKHSDSCGVSSRAYSEMSRLPCSIGLVVVQQARPVSDEIEKRWHVSHETPQVLIVRDDTVVWNASHFQIKAASVEAALNEANGQQ
jgi:bacillithiol system protein YtxJ